ncbi:MAG: hypothetical protein JO084_01675 [Bradyrhizobiaceae bacterium]|nr:hypothetical protein [Hyphomicrobiales bacterium]MBV9426419.1 hypothetical protein [Bradyrhizobiaceae bacterium]
MRDGNTSWPVRSGVVPVSAAFSTVEGDRWSSAVKALAALAIAVSALFAARSAWLGYALVRPAQFRDQINTIQEYLLWLDGQYHLAYLWSFHNEHRLLTSRLLFLIDGVYFDFSNRFLIASIYSGLLLITFIFTALALKAPTASRIAAGTLALLGIGWSVSQFENLTMGFQTQFMLVHLFAFACFFCFIEMLSAVGAWRRLAWLALACAANGLGMLSSAGGVMIGFAAIGTCLPLRAWNRFVAIFIVFHAAAAAAYFIGVPDHPGAHGAAILDMGRYFLRCLGSIARTRPHAPALLGLAMLSIAIFLSLRSLRKVADRAGLILLAVIWFVIAQAAATTVGRAGLGIEQALSSRYATQSAIFAMAIIALCWRSLPTATARCATIIAVLVATFVANDEQNVREAEDSIAARDTAMFSFINGVYAPSQIDFIYPDAPTLERVYQRLAELRKGPFALSAAVYRPPLNSVTVPDVAKLPACRAHIDSVSDHTTWTEISGWFDAHGWIFAYTDAGRLVGYTTSSIRRPEIASALSLPEDRLGFDLFLNNDRIAGERLRLIAVSPAPATPCIIALPTGSEALRRGNANPAPGGLSALP